MTGSRGATIAYSGQVGHHSMDRGDPVQVATAARALLRERLRAGDDPGKVERVVRARLPEAWELLDHNALVALARSLEGGCCHWCAAFVQTATAGVDELAHTASHSALLGAPCPACRRRQGIDRARAKGAAQARQEAALAAAGHLPPARRCTECRAWTPARPLLASGAGVVPLAGPTKRCGTCNGWIPAVTAADVVVARLERGQRAIDAVMEGPPIWQPRRRSIAAAKAAGTYRSRASRRQG